MGGFTQSPSGSQFPVTGVRSRHQHVECDLCGSLVGRVYALGPHGFACDPCLLELEAWSLCHRAQCGNVVGKPLASLCEEHA
jgi:hypothetical protein